MHAVTVYTAPGCVQCNATKRALTEAGIEFREVNLHTDTDARDYVLNDLGYSQAPIIEVDGDDHWFGYRPDRIKALAS
jgi:glutaredoxin-like protein NrdH